MIGNGGKPKGGIWKEETRSSTCTCVSDWPSQIEIVCSSEIISFDRMSKLKHQ